MAKKIDPIPRIKKVAEERKTPKSKWKVAFVQYGIGEVYSSLCEDLLSFHQKRDSHVSSVKIKENEDGSRIVYVYYGQNYRVAYYIEAF